jgi:hypothetical protein
VFYRAWRRYRTGQPLEGVESVIVSVVLRHPEYHPMLEADRPAAADTSGDTGQSNPFLHLGMHIAIEEQLGTDRPPGARACFQALQTRGLDAHAAQHHMMECLGDVLWQAGRSGRPPDTDAYLLCLARLSGRDLTPR